MTKVVNTRNKTEWELLAQSDNGVKLKDLETGKEKMITNEVYNRWYKVVESDEEDTQEETPVEDIPEAEVKAEEVKEEAAEPAEPVAEEKPKKKAGRPRKEKAPKEPKSKEPSVLKDILEKIIKAAECEIFVTQVKGFHTVKIGGKMCMAYTFSTKGITLWMRSAAIENLNLETKYMKHMFDRRLMLKENNEETVDIMRQVVAASVEYQKARNQERADKEKARTEYLKERAAKKEERKKKNMEAKFGVKQKKADKVNTEEEPKEEGEE